jgi:hypothetical protein
MIIGKKIGNKKVHEDKNVFLLNGEKIPED